MGTISHKVIVEAIDGLLSELGLLIYRFSPITSYLEGSSVTYHSIPSGRVARLEVSQSSISVSYNHHIGTTKFDELLLADKSKLKIPTWSIPLADPDAIRQVVDILTVYFS